MDSTAATQKREAAFPFGEIVKRSDPYVFQSGIPGFESFRKFVFEDLKDYTPFRLFRSLDNREIYMIVLSAEYLRNRERFKIAPAELKKVGATAEKDIELYVILRVKVQTGEFVANTKAPLIVNPRIGQGIQIILDDEGLDGEYPLKLLMEI